MNRPRLRGGIRATSGGYREGSALIGVQAEACAPIWAVYTGGRAGLGWVREADTRAEGIRIFQPLRGDEVLAAIERSGGFLLAVREDQILEGEHELARLGFYVEPTSAVVWPAVLDSIENLIDPVVLVLTGSGYKRPVDAAGA
jgi:threonine synthase